MTEQEIKELDLFHKWYLDYSHEGNISDRALTFMEDAWLGRANLDKDNSEKEIYRLP